MAIKKIDFSYLLIGATFFIYVLTRAIKVGATYDEVFTIEELCSFSFFKILFLTAVANNHVVNTVLIKLLFLTGSDSLFIARLPNLVALIGYLYFGYKIASRNLSPAIGLGCFTLLVCNPFLLEFFGLARGYGLSLAFMMGSVYFASENVKSFSHSTFSRSLIFGALSVFTVYSMLYFWVALAIILNTAVLLKENRVTFKNAIRHSFYIGSVLAFFISLPLIRMIIHKKLYYGGHTSFYEDTLISLTQYTLYHPGVTTLTYTSLNLFLAATTAITLAAWVRKKQVNSCSKLFISLAILPALLIITAHHLTGTLYPIDRVALFFYPLLILPLCFSLNEIRKKVSIPILLAFTFGLSFNLISNSNLYKTELWPFDAHSEKILQILNKQGEKEGKVVNLQIDWFFQPSIEYYLKRGRYPFIQIIDPLSSAINPEAGYYLFLSGKATDYISELREERGLEVEELCRIQEFLKYPEEQVVVFDLKKRTHTQL
ncbi:hypothetical protein AXK11_02670 [Cephaloticoccus primus]|uniref:Glycosyltransferase RgtA/B/C/D-like domain-containing protein n=1 Tax=Cephaloticoccus primus TaxID=1548207 RepID=A0A139SRK0_9BACT|nr:hypothetical protein [Cephaloticoccus primus]KXU37225.1 hypothetical protein AXK11_02670 [Cephaloticoccus primus]